MVERNKQLEKSDKSVRSDNSAMLDGIEPVNWARTKYLRFVIIQRTSYIVIIDCAIVFVRTFF